MIPASPCSSRASTSLVWLKRRRVPVQRRSDTASAAASTPSPGLRRPGRCARQGAAGAAVPHATTRCDSLSGLAARRLEPAVDVSTCIQLPQRPSASDRHCLWSFDQGLGHLTVRQSRMYEEPRIRQLHRLRAFWARKSSHSLVVDGVVVDEHLARAYSALSSRQDSSSPVSVEQTRRNYTRDVGIGIDCRRRSANMYRKESETGEELAPSKHPSLRIRRSLVPERRVADAQKMRNQPRLSSPYMAAQRSRAAQ